MDQPIDTLPLRAGPSEAGDLAVLIGPGAALDFGFCDATLARRHRVVPVRDAHGQAWLLAEAAPHALLQQALEARLRAPLHWQPCADGAIEAWLAAGEAGARALDSLASRAEGRAAPQAHANGTPELTLQQVTTAAAQSAPAVRLLDAVLYDALRDGASDIHLEMRADGAEVRARLDGVLQPLQRIDGAAIGEQMVSRLKVMAELDIGERRLPQDGRFALRVDGREVDFRLSIMPSVHGEDAVVRVLDRSAVDQGQGLTLAALGFEPALREALLALARRPHGMLLATGPTGSGKTTTLYAALQDTAEGGEKTITIEDPVEYELRGVVQIPVNERKGLGFARGLRSILRHDPDRILVGEIRDAETAQIAVQAALTGHLVFSSVHANSAFDVIGRFIHLGLDPYHLVSALNAVLAQRLLRVLCPHCAVPQGEWRRAVGCTQCHGTGYRGRRAVAELLTLDDELRDRIAARAPLAELKAAARARGLVPLRHAAMAAARDGWTTPEEVLRVTDDAL